MKILVIGCGSIGDRHIGNLISLKSEEVLACDLDLKRLNYVKSKYKIQVFDDIEKGLGQKPDVVFICTPPVYHVPLALKTVENNAHVFIEKPLSNSLEGLNKLIKKAEEKHLHIFVGYNFRFEKGMQLVKKMLDEGKIGRVFSARAEFGQYLPDWRPWQDYTKSYTARKDLGGGIILDGSHEIDYMRWLFGEGDIIFCFADKVSSLKANTEDVSEIFIRFKKEVICEIHLDFIRRSYSRKCEIIGEKGIIAWDFSDRTVKIYDIKKNNWIIKKISSETNDMYIEEVKHFLNVIKKDEKSLTGIHSGKKTLELALSAKKSAETY